MYPSQSDYELLYMIHQNDEESLAILLQRYHAVIWAIVHELSPKPVPYEIDLEDLHQEGTLGLMDAVNRFREDKEISFGTFARVCIDRQIRTALRKYRSHTYRLLSKAVSLDSPINEDEDLTLLDVLAIDNRQADPIYCTDVKWAQEQIPMIKEGLPEYQWDIYHYHALGYSYREIAQHFGISEKDVDNVIQKIRKKISRLFDTL